MNQHPSPRPSRSPSRHGRCALFRPATLLLCLAWPTLAFAAAPTEQEAAPRAGSTAPAGIAHILKDLPIWGALSTPTAPFDANEQEYVLIGFGRQGFHQTSGSDMSWTLNLPGPTLTAQLFKRGAAPQAVLKDARVTWELEAETVPNPKTAPLRGEMVPADDGISFTAEIPASPHRVDGVLNPYPVVRLTAVDARTNKVLAESAAVVAVSPGFGCATCHAGAGKTVLERHDKLHRTGLAALARKGGDVNCRSCHADDGSGKAGINLSAALHGRHAPQLAGKGEDACLSCHIGLGRSPSDGDAPSRPLFARDMHTQRGLTCVSCHGTVEDHALGLLRAEDAAGRAPAKALMARITPRAVKTADEIAPRQAWAQQPDCAACHDYASKPGLDASAFNYRTQDASGLFAVRADDTGAVMCAACHGAPHALYPAQSPIGRDRDNIAPIQYQQHARALGAAVNCAMCHTQDMDAPAHHPLVNRERTAITLPAEVRPTLPPVSVSHQAHAALDCKACHHTGRVDGKSMSCTQAGCHDLVTAPSSDGKGTITEPRYFRNAFHGPNHSCFACHSSAQTAGRPAGPTACKDCHMTPSPRWDAKVGGTTEPARPAEETSASTPAQEATSQPPAPTAGRNGTR